MYQIYKLAKEPKDFNEILYTLRYLNTQLFTFCYAQRIETSGCSS